MFSELPIVWCPTLSWGILSHSWFKYACPFSLSSFSGISMFMCFTFVVVHSAWIILFYFVLFFQFFSLCFSVLKVFFINMSWSSEILSSAVERPSKHSLYVLQCFQSLVFLLSSPLLSPPFPSPLLSPLLSVFLSFFLFLSVVNTPC